MPDKLGRKAERIAQTNNTLGIDDLSTQPSSVGRRVDARIPVEFGRYRLLKQLGEGGMGVVYLAHDIELDRKVALKLPHFAGAKAAAFAERFRREARLAATLDHPNICRMYDIGEHERRLFLTMNYVEGRSLHEIIRSKGAIEPRTAVALLRRIAQAVHFAHKQGVIHRDLKPANIMIKKNRDFVIMDFGLARRVDQEEAQLTATGAVLGTPAYMAPEQLRSEKGASGTQSDVYSLGIILYELLTGQRPFQGTVPQIYAQILTTDSVSPASVRDGIEPELVAICQKATHKETAQRYQTAEEFAAALGQCLNATSSMGLPPQAIGSQSSIRRSLPTAHASSPPRGRTPMMFVALGGAAFIPILLAAIVILVRNQDGTTTELHLPDDVLAVEVRKDDRPLATVNVAEATEPPAAQPFEMSSSSQLPAENLGDKRVASGNSTQSGQIATSKTEPDAPEDVASKAQLTEYFSLNIVGHEVDVHSLKLSQEGLRSTRNIYRWPVFEVNGQRWEPEVQPLLSSIGLSELVPPNLNFSAAKVKCISTNSAVDTKYIITSKGVDIDYIHQPTGAGDCRTVIRIPYTNTVAEDMSQFGVSWNEPWTTYLYEYPPDENRQPPTREMISKLKATANFQFEKLDFVFWDQGTTDFGEFQSSIPKNYFVIAGQRSFKCPDGIYSVESCADDGVRVWVDDVLVIDDWEHYGRVQHRTQESRLAAGEHVVRFDYYELAGTSRLFVNVRRVE